MIIIILAVVFPTFNLQEKKCNDSNQNESNPKNHFLVATINYEKSLETCEDTGCSNKFHEFIFCLL